ncbi:hypothetical protein [Treponema sp. R6D11]
MENAIWHMDICVIRKYSQTVSEFFRWRNSKTEYRKAVFCTAWKPRRKSVVDGAPKKPKE